MLSTSLALELTDVPDAGVGAAADCLLCGCEFTGEVCFDFGCIARAAFPTPRRLMRAVPADMRRVFAGGGVGFRPVPVPVPAPAPVTITASARSLMGWLVGYSWGLCVSRVELVVVGR